MRAAAIQMCSVPDRAANLAAADRLVRRAAADGASLVLLPEKWPALGAGDDLRAAAEVLGEGPALEWARATARELRIDLVAGSLSERVPGEEKLRNTCVHVGPDGEVRAVYRKLHLFDVEVEGRTYRESDDEAPGGEVVLTALADGTRAGLTVCYDLRFPELHRALAVRGARVLLVPSAFTRATTRAHWEILLRARAIENACFVVAANQAGEHVEGLVTGGRSMIVDPWGEVLAAAGEEGEAVVVADLDPARVDEVRAQIPVLDHRRPEVYA